MSTSIATKTLLPVFTLTSIATASDSLANKRVISTSDIHNQEVYYYLPLCHAVSHYTRKNRTPYSYNLYPVILDAAGVPWPEANLYVLSRLVNALDPNIKTFHGIADDLAAYLRFLEEENIDYTEFPPLKFYRPTYRYRSYLTSKIEANELAVTTAKRRIGAVINFYKWLKEEGILSTNLLWKESDRYIQYKDQFGFNVNKKVKTTDISISISKQHDPYDGSINDGGKLKPLLPEEQEWLIDALLSLGNIEMTLIHLVALFSGARIQSVLTIKLRNIKQILSGEKSEIRLQIGLGTGIDTKNNKRMTLLFPSWLYEKLQIYSNSERALKRRKKSGNVDDNQYVFLSVRGTPIYQSKVETETFDIDNHLRHSKNGQGVRQYISERVIPFIKAKYNVRTFHYQFHDLRATFGMNLTDCQLALVEAKIITLHQAREYVKTRMGHSSALVTDGYPQLLCHFIINVKM